MSDGNEINDMKKHSYTLRNRSAYRLVFPFDI